MCVCIRMCVCARMCGCLWAYILMPSIYYTRRRTHYRLSPKKRSLKRDFYIKHNSSPSPYRSFYALIMNVLYSLGRAKDIPTPGVGTRREMDTIKSYISIIDLINNSAVSLRRMYT